MRFLETTISIRLARSTLSFSRKRERRFANQETKKKKKKKEEMEKISNIDRRTEIVYILINELINVLFSFFLFPQNFFLSHNVRFREFSDLLWPLLCSY